MKFTPKFFCYWCKRELEVGEQLTEIKGNFYCKDCKDRKSNYMEAWNRSLTPNQKKSLQARDNRLARARARKLEE